MLIIFSGKSTTNRAFKPNAAAECLPQIFAIANLLFANHKDSSPSKKATIDFQLSNRLPENHPGTAKRNGRRQKGTRHLKGNPCQKNIKKAVSLNGTAFS